MHTWPDLEIEFRSLSKSLLGSRIDIQWGAAGIHCHLTGLRPTTDFDRFNLLAAIAGRKIRGHPLAKPLEDVDRVAADFDAWALGLKNLSSSFKFGMIAEQMTAGGESVGFIYTGSVADPADSSANLCLRLGASMEDIAHDRMTVIVQMSGASLHIGKARGAAEASNPDWTTVAREAVHALEAVARNVCDEPSATLGECITTLDRQGRLHPALAKCLRGMWGFTNQSPGVRHGSDQLPSISEAEARFTLTTCEAGMPLLLCESIGNDRHL
jgi:hypothetical protein